MKTPGKQFPPDEIDTVLAILEEAINNHRRWFESLHIAMLCKRSFPPDILHAMAHTKCDFGKWYYNNTDDFLRDYPDFGDLEIIHKNMHDIARELANCSLNNRDIDAELYQSFLDNQNLLKKMMRSLYNSILEQKYSLDTLTGVANRKAISSMLEYAFESSNRYQRPCSIAMIDIDHFKTINDKYGHVSGDQVLGFIGSFLKDFLRKSDFTGRYGGEEFIVLLPETDINSAFEVMEKCRQKLEATEIKTEETIINLTVSIGISRFQQDDKDVWQPVKRADFALYQAKQEGRNKTVMSD